MAAFSSSFLLDSSSLFFLPNTNNDNNNNLDDPNNPFSSAPQFYHQIQNPPQNHVDHTVTTNINEGSVVSVTNKNSPTTNTMDSSSIVTDPMYDSHQQQLNNNNPMNLKKRKFSNSANTAQSKDKREVKGKKQKKMKKEDEEKKKAEKEAPTGYIHVRARRGQATDSHSLAERVRREKISERMKLLQAIVPGCDKVTGKALMLDEIINYVQSLQNQVEFLSMKLASVNPMYYDFGMDLDSFMVRPDQDLSNLPSPIPGMQDCSPTTANNYLLLDNSANSILFQQAQIPNVLPQAGNRQTLWEVDELRQKNINQSGGFSNNLFSFH